MYPQKLTLLVYKYRTCPIYRTLITDIGPKLPNNDLYIGQVRISYAPAKSNVLYIGRAEKRPKCKNFVKNFTAISKLAQM